MFMRSWNRHRRLFLQAAVFLLYIAASGSGVLFGADPSIVAGVYSEYLMEREEDLSESLDLGLYGVVSWRTALPYNSYAALKATAALTGSADLSSLYDTEYVELEFSSPLSDGYLDLFSSVSTSVTGDGTSGSYIEPQWQIKYRFDRGPRAVNPFFAYEGYYVYQSEGADDRYYNGVSAGLTRSPRIELTWEPSVHVGIERWQQQDRSDSISEVQCSLFGLAGYFVSWELTGGMLYRSSSDLQNSSLTGRIEGTVLWSPKRSLSFSFSPSLMQEHMINDGSDHTDVSGTVRIDAYPSQRVFLYGEGTLFVQDALSSTASPGFSITGGVDLSLDLP
ncbi:MAG: hypothetical protein K9L73_06215 [Spirochaetia bacterium]|nr:hypothetical protein [Spirochaetia bacterium]